MLGSEDFESLTVKFPDPSIIRFHGLDDPSLLRIVQIADCLDQIVDIEHGQICGQRNKNYYVYENSLREVVINAPERLTKFSCNPKDRVTFLTVVKDNGKKKMLT